MIDGVRRTARLGAAFLLLALVCCKRSEPSGSTGSPAPAQPAGPSAPAGDACGAQGTWRFSCPSVKTDEACNIRTIGAIEQRFTLSSDVAQSGETWTAGAHKYTFDRTTCEVSGSTSGMPCRDLHFEANLRTKSGRNVYGCWDGANKCQATWSSPPGHCSVTTE